MYNALVENPLLFSVGFLLGFVLNPVAKLGIKKLVALVKES